MQDIEYHQIVAFIGFMVLCCIAISPVFMLKYREHKRKKAKFLNSEKQKHQ